MTSYIRAFAVSLAIAAVTVPASAGTLRQEIDVRNAVAEFESALRKSDIAAISKLVTPDFVVFQNGEIRKWRPEMDRSATADLSRSFSAAGSKIGRVEVSCDLAWAYARMESHDAKVASPPHLMMVTMYVLRQKSRRWRIAAVSRSVNPQSPIDTIK